MVFPHNIENIVKNASKSTSKDKFNLLLVIFAIADIAGYYFLDATLIQLYRVPGFLVILGILLLNVLVGLVIVRVFIINEKDQLKEFENSKDDSLSRYYFIRERENSKIVEDVEVFENVDGNFFLVLQIFYGPNDKTKSNGTFRFFSRLFNSLSAYCIDFRTYVCREQFRESIECKRFLNNIGRSGQSTLTKTMLEISDAVVDFTEKNSQLYSTYVLIRMSPFQLMNLNGFISELKNNLSSDIHSIRNFTFLNKKEFRDFIRDYYNVEALDLSNIRNPQVSTKLLRMYGSSICPSDQYDYKFNTGVKVND